jgi:hypothetical protein
MLEPFGDEIAITSTNEKTDVQNFKNNCIWNTALSFMLSRRLGIWTRENKSYGNSCKTYPKWHKTAKNHLMLTIHPVAARFWMSP